MCTCRSPKKPSRQRLLTYNTPLSLPCITPTLYFCCHVIFETLDILQTNELKTRNRIQLQNIFIQVVNNAAGSSDRTARTYKYCFWTICNFCIFWRDGMTRQRPWHDRLGSKGSIHKTETKWSNHKMVTSEKSEAGEVFLEEVAHREKVFARIISWGGFLRRSCPSGGGLAALTHDRSRNGNRWNECFESDDWFRSCTYWNL